MDQFPVKNPNPLLSVTKDGIVVYSNKAAEPLMCEWGVKVGGNLPSNMTDLVQRVISLNSPEKLEVKVGNRVYLAVISPLPENKCVSISGFDIGFDISDKKEIEEKPLELEDKYRSIVETANEGICIVDSELRITYVNKKMAEMLGYNEKELIGKCGMEFVVEDQKAYTEQRIEKRLRGIDEVHENKFIRKDGSFLWTLVRTKPFFDTDGKFTGVLAMFTDVTERKRMEEKLRDNEYRLNQAQEFMESVTQGTHIIIAAVDTNFCYTFFNKAYLEEVKRLSGKEIYVGASIMETFAHLPEQQKIVKEQWSEALEGKSTSITLAFGDPGLYQRVYEILHTPILDAEGKIVGAGEVAYDVTEKVGAKEALRESEERFRKVFENAAIGIIIGDLDGRVININPALERMLGYSSGELHGKPFYEFTHPDDVLKENLLIEGILSGDSNHYDIEKRYIRKDGQIINVQFKGSFIGNENGKPIAGIALIEDITERKRAEEALKKAYEKLEKKVKERTVELEQAYNSLKESEKGLADAQRIAHIGNWDWNFISDEIYASDETYRILGYNPKELKPTYDILLNHVHPNDRDYVDDAIKQALKGKPLNIDFRIVSADSVESIVNEQAEIVLDEKNNPVQMRGTIQDITGLKKAEEALRESEERFNLAVKAAQEGVWDWNLETDEVWYSSRYKEMLGYSEDEIEHHVNSWLRLLHPDDKERSLKIVDAVMRGERNYELEFRLRHKDGHYLNILSRGYPIRRESDGKIVRIVGTHFDLTDRKRAEEDLRKSKEQYQALFNSISEGFANCKAIYDEHGTLC
ncbi:MAG: PAS domain S-box protein, partial [Bacteroidota bacterium]|nr:PAS domain S-box protein [Bacteroidota bacterium]